MFGFLRLPPVDDTEDNPSPPLPESTSHPWIRPVAIAEMLAFFAVALLADFVFGDGTRFMDYAFHPFWIIVLLITVQYSASEGILAALLASAFLLIGNLPEQRLSENFYDYTLRTGTLPFLWTATALVLGGLRSREMQKRADLEQTLEKAENDAATIAAAYSQLRTTKEQLEQRLAEERRSVLTVYKAAQAFESARTEHLLPAAAEMLRLTLQPTRFTFYRLQDDTLTLTLAYGWPRHISPPRVIRRDSPLFRAAIENKSTLCITSAQDEQPLGGALLAGPLLSPREEALGLLKIEEMGFAEISARNIEIFRVLCRWIGRAIAQHSRLHAAQDDSAQTEEKATHASTPYSLHVSATWQ